MLEYSRLLPWTYSIYDMIRWKWFAMMFRWCTVDWIILAAGETLWCNAVFKYFVIEDMARSLMFSCKQSSICLVSVCTTLGVGWTVSTISYFKYLFCLAICFQHLFVTLSCFRNIPFALLAFSLKIFFFFKFQPHYANCKYSLSAPGEKKWPSVSLVRPGWTANIDSWFVTLRNVLCFHYFVLFCLFFATFVFLSVQHEPTSAPTVCLSNIVVCYLPQ